MWAQQLRVVLAEALSSLGPCYLEEFRSAGRSWGLPACFLFLVGHTIGRDRQHLWSTTEAPSHHGTEAPPSPTQRPSPGGRFAVEKLLHVAQQARLMGTT